MTNVPCIVGTISQVVPKLAINRRHIVGYSAAVVLILFGAATAVIFHTARAADAGHHWE